jgi:hypothetical protein
MGGSRRTTMLAPPWAISANGASVRPMDQWPRHVLEALDRIPAGRVGIEEAYKRQPERAAQVAQTLVYLARLNELENLVAVLTAENETLKRKPPVPRHRRLRLVRPTGTPIKLRVPSATISQAARI